MRVRLKTRGNTRKSNSRPTVALEMSGVEQEAGQGSLLRSFY